MNKNLPLGRSLSDERRAENNSDKLPFDPADWDKALSSLFGFEEGWADEFKKKYNDPVEEVLQESLPDSYIGEDPSDLQIDDDRALEVIGELDDRQKEAMRELAWVVLRQFFHRDNTLDNVKDAVSSFLGRKVSMFTPEKQDNIKQDLQTALASLNDPDSPYREAAHIRDDTLDQDLTEDTPSYIHRRIPQPREVWEFKLTDGSEKTVRITHYEKENDGVLHRKCVGLVTSEDNTGDIVRLDHRDVVSAKHID